MRGRSNIAFTVINGEFDVQRRTIIKMAQLEIRVKDFDVGTGFDLTRGDSTRTGRFKRHFLRTFGMHAHTHGLDIQDDVGDIFTHARDRRKFVQYTVDLDRSNRRTLERRQQNATQRVTQSLTKTALQRFRHDRTDAAGIRTRSNIKLGRLNQFLPVLLNHETHLRNWSLW